MCATCKDGQWGRSVVDGWVEQETETDGRETEKRRQELRARGKGGRKSQSFLLISLVYALMIAYA